MTVYLFTIVRGKLRVIWLVSKSGGRQLRGSERETEKQIVAQWESQVGEIDKLVRQEEEVTTHEAEQIIATMRRRHLESKAANEQHQNQN